MTLRPSNPIKRGSYAGRGKLPLKVHTSRKVFHFLLSSPCHIPPRQILTIQGKVRRARQLQSFLKHDVNARSNRFYCIMFGSCSIWRKEFPAPSSPHRSLVINFSPARRTSFFSKLRRPPGFHIMNHSARAECFEHGNHVPIRHKTEHVVIHKTKAKEFQFYTLLTSSSQNSRNFRRRSLARRSSTDISYGICFIMRKSSFFSLSLPPQMDGAKITCFIQFWNKQTDGEHQRALLPSETRNFNFACLLASRRYRLSFAL